MSHPTSRKDVETRKVKQLLAWYQRHARVLPWRASHDPYGIWISEIMLQQTQVNTVIPYWERWMQALPDITALAMAPLQEIYKLWEGLGYYRRARFLKQAAEYIQVNHDGVFPRTYAEILNLPGIGRYTAGAICSIAFDQTYPVLDGNVKRVLCRYEAVKEPIKSKDTENHLWELATVWVKTAATLKGKTDRPCSEINQALMELGATICLPRSPRCDTCPLQKTCQSFKQGIQNSLPVTPLRRPSTAMAITIVVLKHQSRFFVRHKENEHWHQGLWEFPSETAPKPSEKPWSGLTEIIKAPRTKFYLPTKTVQHAITRYRIRSTAYFIELKSSSSPLLSQIPGEWFSLEELMTLPMSAAHMKFRKMLVKHFTGPCPELDGRTISKQLD